MGKSLNLPVEKGMRKEENAMQKWVCTLCGFIYDPAVGNMEAGIPPGTAFEDLPDGWVCPVCGASKEMFEPA